MMGKICTYQKCPKCGGGFKRITVSATFQLLICPNCQIQPTRVFLDIYDKRQRHRISRDERGYILSSADMANALLTEIRRREFDPTKYVRRQLARYQFQNVIAEWLQRAEVQKKEGKIANGTLEVKRRYARTYFEPLLHNIDIREFKTLDVEHFRMNLQDHLSPQTKNNILAQLQNLIRYGYKALQLDGVPPEVEFIEFQRKTPQGVDHAYQNRTLDCLPKRHRPIFEFMVLTGCRPSMARALQWQDIRWGEHKILFRHNYSNGEFGRRLKGRKELGFPLTPPIEALLRSLPRHISGHVFVNPSTGRPYGVNFREILRRAERAAGINHVPLKNLTRHSFAINLLESGRATPRDVSYLLGHSSEQVTRTFYDNARLARLGKLLEG